MSINSRYRTITSCGNVKKVKGTFRANALMNVLSAAVPATPLVKLQLQLKDSPVYREYFKKGEITDILLLMGCRAKLPNYPL